MPEFKYRSDWEMYDFPEPESHISTPEEMKKTILTRVDFSDEKVSTSGIPLIADGSEVYLNGENEHWLIVGESGSKKTRCCVKPLIASLAKARESMIVTDVKGEISGDARLMSYLKENGIKLKYLDFRNKQSDGYNLLDYPRKLFASGKTDEATAIITNIVAELSSRYDGAQADPYWNLMSQQFIIPIIQMLVELPFYNPPYRKYCNFLSAANFCDDVSAQLLQKVINRYYEHEPNNPPVQMLKNVLSTPDRTRQCIISTSASILKDFMLQINLLKMLSCSTFEIEALFREPTALFLILPDETTAYNDIGGMMIDLFFAQLITEYTNTYQNRKDPPCRINWVLEEMANVRINSLNNKISAGRSRFQRMFCVIQSLKQMREVYPKDADSVIGNTKNLLFLQSSDPEMLGYISDRTGKTTVSETGVPEPLLNITHLKKLKKSYTMKEAVYIRDDCVFKAELPDYEEYDFLKKYEQGIHSIKTNKFDEVEGYSAAMFYHDLENGLIERPFDEAKRKEKLRNLNNSSGGAL